MFWQRKRATRRHVNENRSQPARRRLLLEGLERRAMMTGTVNIVIFPVGAPGTLTLVGDGSNNQVEIHQTANVNEFFISSPDNTKFQVNGAGFTVDQFTAN